MSDNELRREKARNLYVGGTTIEQITRELKCSPNTAMKWCKDIIRPVNKRWKSKNEFIILESHAVLRIFNGNTCTESLIDIEDVDKIKGFNKSWYAAKFGHCKYVTSKMILDGKRKAILLHRVLMGDPIGLVVDHINGNTLDNRKSNLRSVTQSANMQNRHVAKRNGTSGVRGVYYHKKINRWIARIGIDGQSRYIGCFKELTDAEKAVKQARGIHMPYSPEWRELNNGTNR